MSSIRRALGLRLAFGACPLLLGAAGLLHLGVRWLLVEQFDDALRSKLSTFAILIEQEGDYVELGFVDQAMPEFRAASEPEYVELWLADRADDWVLYRSPSLAEDDLPRLGGTQAEPRFEGLELPDGRAGRAIGAQFLIENHDPGEENRPAARVELVLARGTAALDGALGLLWIGSGSVLLVLIVAGFLLGGGALRHGLRPLEELAAHVGTIDDPARALPYELERMPAELVPLVESHNRMLKRVRGAFERERRTAANIAHELRTPVAELVVLAEAAQRYRADPGECERPLAELRELGEQMSSLIAILLELARMESGQVPLELEAVDLAEMLGDCWAPLSAAARVKGQRLQGLDGPGPIVQADRVALSILLANLLRNAVDHAPPGDLIRCAVEGSGERACLVISNDAGGLHEQDLEHVSEPFWRANAERSDRSHAGIGLSLARRFAELLEVPLTFTLDSGTFRARLGLRPVAASSRSSGQAVG